MKTTALLLHKQTRLNWPGKPGGPSFFLLVLILICLVILVFGLPGCSNIGKATQQVLGNDAAFNKIGAAWAKLNPCVVDSTKTLVHDTTVTTDTLFAAQPNVPPAPSTRQADNHSAAQPTAAATPGGWGYITKTITVHDSVKIVSVDKRLLAICNDSVAWYKIVYDSYRVNATKQLDGWEHKAQTRLWYLIGLAALVGFYLFRKPLLSLFGGLPAILSKII